uniref:Uncharacterized protein n=1 Tax=Lepeophtheirus salmonis TaxID=72036 RepID=A0A0K2SWW9_LEPSM
MKPIYGPVITPLSLLVSLPMRKDKLSDYFSIFSFDPSYLRHQNVIIHRLYDSMKK